MSRMPLIALLVALCCTSCSKPPIDEAVYADFQLNFLSPEEWDEELEDLREDRCEQKLAHLRQVVVKVEVQRAAYAKRCQALAEPNSSACESLNDMNEILTAIGEMENGLRTGQTIKGTLGQYMNYGLDGARLEHRTALSKRVRELFIEEKNDEG